MEWDLFPFLFMVNKFKRMAAGVYSIHADYFMLYCYLFQTTLSLTFLFLFRRTSFAKDGFITSHSLAKEGFIIANICSAK